jgi:hypothetical protein
MCRMCFEGVLRFTRSKDSGWCRVRYHETMYDLYAGTFVFLIERGVAVGKSGLGTGVSRVCTKWEGRGR